MKCPDVVLSLFVIAQLVFVPQTFCADHEEQTAEIGKRAADTGTEPDGQETLETKLARRVSVKTEGESLSKFIERISEEMDLNVAIDHGAFDPKREPQVRKVSLRNIPLGTALTVVLKSVGLDYRAYEQFVYISTPARLREHSLEKIEIRVYERTGAAGDTLPKVALINPAGAGQQGLGSIMQLMVPVNPALVGEPPARGQSR
jgi:hypothetical protein